MKKMSKTRIVMWIFAIAPLILVAFMYNRLPDQIPTNWGFNGEISYGSKTTLWWLSGMSPILAVMFMFLPRIDPRKKNYEKFRGLYDGFALFMMVFMLGFVALIISESLNPGKISVELVIVAACGLLFVFIGNMMPKVKSNFFVGIKTPWALSNTEVWNKTHRLGGYLFFFGGLLTIVMAFFLREYALFITLMVIVAVMVIVPAVMSYVWYKKLKNEHTSEAH